MGGAIGSTYAYNGCSHWYVYRERIYGTDKHILVVNVFIEYDIVVISHHTTPNGRRNAVVDKEEVMGPKAAGVILAVIDKFAG